MPWLKNFEEFEIQFENVKEKLSEIFTPQYSNAVKKACQRYLQESAEDRPGIMEDGEALLKISEKALELLQMLKINETAVDRMKLYVIETYCRRYDITSWLEDLKEKLQQLVYDMCLPHPASELAKNPPQHRPPGTRPEAERAFAFNLSEIYRQAHGHPAPRIVNRETGGEEGPLIKATEILGPILGLRSNLAWHFRKIQELQSNGD